MVWLGSVAIILTVVLVLGAIQPVIDVISLSIIFLFLLIVLAVAARSTEKIWESGRVQNVDQLPVRAKGKRRVSNRVARLVDGLDEDELVELETLLMVRDEDMV